jgi:hypothetical protein
MSSSIPDGAGSKYQGREGEGGGSWWRGTSASR